MPENKRLSELLKQKELITNHLKWIDSEISLAQTSNQTTASTSGENNTQTTPHPKTPEHPKPDQEPQPTPEPEVIEDTLPELTPNTKSAAYETKRGCFIAFGIAVLAFASLIGLIYYIY